MDESIYALNAECDAMQDEIARLEAENAELLEQLKYERQTSRSRLESIDLLKVENAKLRELVMHLYEYRQTYFRTGIYPTDHGVTERRMRELGIEVDG